MNPPIVRVNIKMREEDYIFLKRESYNLSDFGMNAIHEKVEPLKAKLYDKNSYTHTYNHDKEVEKFEKDVSKNNSMNSKYKEQKDLLGNSIDPQEF